MTAISEDVLLQSRDGDVVVLTLNRPTKKNALSFELRRQITSAFRAFAHDPSLAAIVLTGAGDAFSAGVDLKELGGESGGSSATGSLAASEFDMVGAMRACHVPIIGAVNGVAITGGFELALACDVIYASTSARFADTHARVGILPTWGMTLRLPRLIGMARAKELSFGSQFLDAATAERWGLVNRVFAPDELLPAALALANENAFADAPTVRSLKGLYDDANDGGFTDGLAHESRTASAHMKAVKPADIAARREAVQARSRAQLT